MERTADEMAYLMGGIGAVAGLVVLFFGGKLWTEWYRKRELRRAYLNFRQRREQLEAGFYDLAKSLGKPRGVRWLECRWQDRVTFGRDRQTGLLTAFVGVNISFEAIEGEGMEDVAAVSSLRDAAAVFHYQYGNWGTGGRALFNMDPDTALTLLKDQYESVAFQSG